MREYVERECNFRRMQLAFKVLQRLFHRSPKVDLLHRRTSRRVVIQLGDRLHGTNPAIHLGMQLIDKGVVLQQRWRLNGFDATRVALTGRADRRMNAEYDMRNFHILLCVSQAEL